ncbi:MAG: hypothetical protein ABIR00_06940 [Nitrosospira sp.]
MNSALENEQKALLERMDASRKNYRAMFVHEDEHEQIHDMHAFPRSHTFKFIARHPYYVSGALVALSLVSRGRLNKAVKGSIALTAGILGRSARTLVMRQVLPSVISSLRSRNRRP